MSDAREFGFPTRLDVDRDSLDFRDRIYRPALVALSEHIVPEPEHVPAPRQQGDEGACTGFGLAAMIDYLNRKRGIDEPVSPRMIYEMAKRHDRWPGQDYEGSSARGAMKGWHKNGVCRERDWRYRVGRPGYFTQARQEAALAHPLGAYYRILPSRVDVHAALAETGAVFATARVHKGWMRAFGKPTIPFKSEWCEADGSFGHAFAILGYTDAGFLVLNSWGEDWGGAKFNGTAYRGLTVWTYADFDHNLWDAWVARMARPVESLEALGHGHYVERPSGIEAVQAAPPQHEIRNAYVHIDDGQFDPRGDYPSSRADTRELLKTVLGTDNGNSPPKHLLLYAHGGLNEVKGAAARVGKWQRVLNDNGIHGIHFIWETGLWAEVRDVLLGKETFVRERAGGVGDWWDNWVERASAPLGRPLWKEMHSDAELAFKGGNAGTVFLRLLASELKKLPANKRPKLHLAGHSAGSIWLGYLLERWMTAHDMRWETLILFAPACTHDFFVDLIRPALEQNTVKMVHHFLLDDDTEKNDNVAQVYRKSLLYLVSRAFEKQGEVVPLLGMATHLPALDTGGVGNRIRHYDTANHSDMTTSGSHGGFDNDKRTMNNLLRLVLGGKPTRQFEDADLTGY